MTSTVFYAPDVTQLPECEPSVFNDVQTNIRLFGGEQKIIKKQKKGGAESNLRPFEREAKAQPAAPRSHCWV